VPFVTANGVRLHYEEAGSGPPLVLLQGHGLDWSFWAKQLPVYGQHFRCLALDNRGVGKSDVPSAGYGVDDMAADTLGFMDVLGIPAAHVSGFSMGGSIAMAMALRASARVLTLSLHSTTGRVHPFMRHRYRLLIGATRSGDPELWAEATVLTAFRDTYINTHDEIVEAGAARRRGARAAMTAEQVEGLIGHYLAFSTYDPGARLAAIRRPTLITVGADDAVTPVEYSRDLHALIPGSELHVIPDAPHRALTFAAEEFNRVSLEFLLRHAGRSSA